ncbi:DUF481 domain-containing protein [Bdellovibrio bacteriovorus]|uniref:DUF481 domain-containing protein n=1 Tax=Bdellovibrio bacteriovorus str. Tiberius TaxID=1069642 RepID=K7ZCF2_BDEBC|nr:DUF481 domain-containing protein [Bdellovibrio bacteriovorus]AFY03179.1 hypothetical protein Bdt_3504 [Bdellovibrio bacteriovorus str. Tiberius]
MLILFLAIASLFGASSKDTLHTPSPFHVTLEMSLLEMRGGSDSDSYAASLDAGYDLDAGKISLYGHFLRTKDNGIENNRNWLGGFRLERNLNLTETRGYYFHQMESDPYAGIIQRDSDEVGVQQRLVENGQNLWLVEAGIRYMKVNPLNTSNRFQTAARLHSFYQRKLTARLSAEVWAEYIPNFTDAGMDLANAEIGLGSSLSPQLFVKLGYLLQYQRQPFASLENTSSLTTLNLIASY